MSLKHLFEMGCHNINSSEQILKEVVPYFTTMVNLFHEQHNSRILKGADRPYRAGFVHVFDVYEQNVFIRLIRLPGVNQWEVILDYVADPIMVEEKMEEEGIDHIDALSKGYGITRRIRFTTSITNLSDDEVNAPFNDMGDITSDVYYQSVHLPEPSPLQ